MKKITTLFSALVLTAFGWQTNAQILNQNAAWPNMAWTIGGTYTAGGLINDPTATANFTFDDDAAGNGSVDAINAESPVIDLTAANTGGETWININGNFDYYELGDALTFEYWDADASSWVVLETLTGNTTTTTDYQNCVSTGTYATTTLNIAAFTATQLSGFKYRINYDDAAGWKYGFCFDSPTIVSSMPPSCSDPSALMVSNITLTSVDLGWTENGSATTWDIEWGAAGFTQGAGTMITGTTTNPHNLTGLTANTSYDFYVRADCGGANGVSAWSPVGSFYTGYCIPSSTGSATYVDDFSTTNGSVNISNLTTGFTTGGYVDYTAQSVQSFATGTFDFNAVIVGGTAGFSIWVDWNNDLVFDDATEKVFNTTSYGNGPFTGTITVPTGTTVGNYAMRITTDWNQSNPSDPCAAQSRAEFEDYTIDVIAPPTCLAPSVLTATNITATSADLGWTENGSATTWDIEWGAAGFTQGAGTMVTGTTTNPHSLTGLTASTAYDFYVRADCGTTNGLSTWAGPFAFATPCAAMTLPYTETFDGIAPALPTCWTTNNAAEVITTASCTGSINESLQLDGSAGNYAYSPVLDASGLDSLHVEYLYRAGDTDCGNAPETTDSVKVDYWDGSAWSNLMMYGGGTNSPVIFTPELVNITAGLTNSFYLRFEVISGTGTGFDNWNFDSLVVTGFATSVGVNNIANNVNLSVYPNPTNGVFTLNVNTTDVNELDIKVMNMQGQVVFAKNNFDNIANVKEQIDLSNNANGIYFVTVTTDKGVLTHKVVVQ